MEANFLAEKPLGYRQILAAQVDPGVQLAGVPDGTSLILIIAEAQAIRWRDDGTAPTATVGQPLAAGIELRYTGRSPSNLRFISQTAGAIINLTFYGGGQ